MKSLRPLLAFAALLLLALPASAAETSVAGYWAGAITPPNQPLPIGVELIAPTSGSAWQGKIDIPAQGLRGFALTGIKVDGLAVEFALPGLPGDPHFSGTLSADGKSISGDFTQGANSLPFRLEQTSKPAAPVREPLPAQGVAGDSLPGKWIGAIAPFPNIELRLALELSADTAGKVGGVLVSLDQGNARIPLPLFTEDKGEVRFETPPAVAGSFAGKLNADGSEIAGEWSQRGNSVPLVFKRLPPSP